jgi:hypothetical protein
MTDRWSTLRDVAVNTESPQLVYWRWVDYLTKPLNATEYRRVSDTFIVYEHANGQWVIEGTSPSVSREPQRFFATEQEAIAALTREGYTHTRTWPVYERAPASSRNPLWMSIGGWLLLTLALCALLVALVVIIRLLSARG